MHSKLSWTKRTIVVLSFALAVVTAAAADQKPGRGKPGKAAKQAKAADHGRSKGQAIRFSTVEAGAIREQYGKQFQRLPPGLQKKVARGGQLPPGWQKRMQPFPMALQRRLGTLPADYGRGVIDGNAVIYHLHSHAVIDVTVLF